MSIIPDSLSTPTNKLTRAQIFAEFAFMHALAGGKKNVGNLTKIYRFDNDTGNMVAVIDAPARYAELDQEMHDRRARQAKYLEYVNRGAHGMTKLESVCHLHQEQGARR